MFEPTVQGDTRALQRGLNRLGTARMGPVSIGPGDGHIRYYDASGRTTFRTDGAGAQVYAHGALRPLGGAIESKASQTYVDGNIATLTAKNAAQDGRMDGHDGRMDTMQTDIDSRATSSWVSSVRSDLQGQVDEKASNDRVDTLSGQVANKAEDSRVDTLSGTVSKISGQLASKASNARVDTLSGQVQTLIGQFSGIRAEMDNVKQWLTYNTSYPSNAPAAVRNFLQTGEV